MQTTARRVPFVPWAFAILASSVAGQVQVHDILGDQFGANLGMTLAGVGDLDMDGVPDFVLGASDAFVPGIGIDTGFLEAYSGRDASLLFRIDGDEDGWNFGRAVVTVGDLNGDGVPEFAVSAKPIPDAGEPPVSGGLVRMYSGADRTILWERFEQIGWGFGEALAKVGDIDRDGDPDLLIGDSGCHTLCYAAGRVLAVDAATGQTVLVVSRGEQGSAFGSSVVGLGDVDGDDYPDFAAGAPMMSDGNVTPGAVWVVSGFDGSTIFTLGGNEELEQFGTSLARLGDTNGNGAVDFAVGAPFGTPGYLGHVRVFTTLDGSQLFEVEGGGIGGQQFGITVAGIGDQDGDGLSDFVVGDPKDNPGGGVCCSGAAFVYSGLDGTLLASYAGVSAGFSEYWLLGHVVANVGDLNGDGLVDWAASTPYRSQEKGGAAVFLTDCPASVVYCTAKANSLGCVPTIATTGATSLALPTAVIDATDVVNNKNGILFYGLNGRAALPFSGGLLCATPPLRRTGFQNAAGNPPPTQDCSGAFAFGFGAYAASGQDPLLLPGQQVQAQYWMRDPAHPDGTGTALSDAVELFVCD